MAIAEIPNSQLDVRDERRSLPGVADTDAGYFRAFAIGAGAGTVAVFLLFVAIGIGLGLDPGAVLGIAAFAAVWGGPGFGGMAGAVLHRPSSSRTHSPGTGT